jgi:hypothetical protein
MGAGYLSRAAKVNQRRFPFDERIRTGLPSRAGLSKACAPGEGFHS